MDVGFGPRAEALVDSSSRQSQALLALLPELVGFHGDIGANTFLQPLDDKHVHDRLCFGWLGNHSGHPAMGSGC